MKRVLMTAAILAVLAALADCGRDGRRFTTQVDNAFFPLVPGTTFSYEGTKEDASTADEVFVTHETRRIDGVECLAVRDQAFEDGVLVEDTLDFYAQDDRGNVWYFGEDTRELDENGNVISTEGSWEAGVNGAEPGIIMESGPRVGDRYDQEHAAGVAEDRAEVTSRSASTCVGFGCFTDVLETEETTPLEPDMAERKLYAQGVGFIQGDLLRGGSEHTELVSVTTGG